MKTIALLTCTFFAQFAVASQAYSGFINKINSNYYFNAANSTDSYQIVPLTQEVYKSLSRLSTGDAITGNGVLDLVHHSIALETVDFVGLRRLLGPWITEDGVMTFRDFYNMTYRALNGRVTEFHYSISPSEGNEWMLFLSDSTHTILATLEFDSEFGLKPSNADKKHALMKIFESRSGRVLRTLKLERP